MNTNWLLATYQFKLSWGVLFLFAVALGLYGFHLVPYDVVRDMSPVVMLVIVYWFQRQRHSGTADQDSPDPTQASQTPNNSTSTTTQSSGAKT